MSRSRTAALRGALVVGLLAGAASTAPTANAAVDVNTLTSHTTELEDLGVLPPCSQVNVVVARGTDEQANISPGLDGWYWDSRSMTYKTGPKSPYGAWNRIARELYQPTDARFAAYTSPNDVLRTDVSYAASADLLTSVTSGTVRLMNYLRKVHERCPSTRFVLLGYSQGALVVENAVAVPSRRISYTGGTQALTSGELNQIAAIATVADTAFSLAFNPNKIASRHEGTMIQTGYAAGTLPDVEHLTNDGNYDPAFYGLSPRSLNAYPVRSGTGAPAGSVVDGSLTEDVVRKWRNYCFARDWACQNSNPNNDFAVHTNTPWHQSSKQNLAIWSIERIRRLF